MVAEQEDRDVREWVRLASQGDHQASRWLYQRYRPLLAVMTSARIPAQMRQRFDTEDVLQSSFSNAFHALKDYEFTTEEAFRSWLLSVALNKLHDRVRANRAGIRSAYKEISGVDFDARQDDHSQSETPSVIVSQAERRARLLSAIQSLPQPQRDIVTMRCLESRGWSQIAAHTALSEDQVRRRYSDALQTMQRIVG